MSEGKRVHLLPFKFDSDHANAGVSSYFVQEQEGGNLLTTLRGRALRGSEVDLPNGAPAW